MDLRVTRATSLRAEFSMEHPVAPVIGLNSSVQHNGRAYHVQTEDSGVERPHVITHLFADGGRIIVTRRTDYAAEVGTHRYPAIVKRLVLVQHREMLVRLGQGHYDAADDRRQPQEEGPFDLSSLGPVADAMPSESTAPAAPVTAAAPASVDASANQDHQLLNLFLGLGMHDSADSIDDLIVRQVALFLDTQRLTRTVPTGSSPPKCRELMEQEYRQEDRW